MLAFVLVVLLRSVFFRSVLAFAVLGAALLAIVLAVSVAFLRGDPELLITVTGLATLVTMIFFLSVKKLRPAFVAALAILAPFARAQDQAQQPLKVKKIVVYKYKKRKGYARKRGHRQAFTRLSIQEIRVG